MEEVMKSLQILREDLRVVDDEINEVGWGNAHRLLKTYRHWLLEAIQFIQLKHFVKS